MLKRHINSIKLICYFIITPLILWNATIGKSIGLWKVCEKKKQELSELHITKNAENSKNFEVSTNGSLLDSIAKDKHVEVVKYNRFISASSDDYSLITNVLIVKGDFYKLMEAINRLEHTWTLNSLSFQTELNYKTKQTSLNTTIITQEIVSNVN